MNREDKVKIYENEKTIITVKEDWCKLCGICIHFCPKNVLVKSETGYPIAKNIDNCINCRLCELRCPDFAIQVEKKEKIYCPNMNHKGLED